MRTAGQGGKKRSNSGICGSTVRLPSRLGSAHVQWQRIMYTSEPVLLFFVGCAWTGHLLGLYVFAILHLLVPSPQMAYPPDQTGSPACPKRTIDEIYSTLGVWEAPWRDKQRFLQSRGYTLRPRYQHDWIPSWRKSNENPFFAEDGIAAPVSRQRHHIVPLINQARLVNI